ncbi:MAG TPA: hypothetical protein ENI22_00935 [Candidatus Pacearchaeota archaeon]|nr:hypothetical protein [Candidatus Pacearchaeota archaeon]
MRKKQKKRNFFSYNFFPKNHRGIISDYLPWILIAVAVLVILMITIFLLKEKGISLVDQIKNLLR